MLAVWARPRGPLHLLLPTEHMDIDPNDLIDIVQADQRAWELRRSWVLLRSDGSYVPALDFLLTPTR